MWTMAAVGLRDDLVVPSKGGGPALALVPVALWARTTAVKRARLWPPTPT